jgi:hypothetical protein
MCAWEAANPYKTFKKDGTLSRILALVPEYDSGRIRKTDTSRGEAIAPTIFTVRELADRLGVPLCALFEWKDHRVFSEAQLEQIAQNLDSLQSIFSRREPPIGSDFDEIVPFRTTAKGDHQFAAGRTGIEEDFAPEQHDVFRDIRGITSDRLQVIRVVGDSMSPLLLSGDRVLIDRSLISPREGDVVAVFSTSFGRVIGYWHRSDEQCSLKKENADPIPLGSREDWTVLGTITSFVDAPLRPKDRLARSQT